MTYIEALARSAALTLQLDVCRRAESAFDQLGMPVDAARQDVARAAKNRVDQSPRLVASVELTGIVFHRMYEESSEHLYSTEGLKTFKPFRLLGLQQGRAFVEGLLVAHLLACILDGACIDRDTVENRLYVTGATIYDQFGRALDRLEFGVGWVAPSLGPDSNDRCKREIDDLQQQACIEAGWDNFETARGLRAQARSLQEEMEMRSGCGLIVP